MANCPWPNLLGEHEVPDFDDGKAKVGDTGSCSRCMGRYRVSGINPCKLAKPGRRRGKQPR